MQFTLPMRVQAAAIGLAVITCLSAANYLLQTVQFQATSQAGSAIAGYDNRFTRIRQDLPPRGHVGYLRIGEDPTSVEYYLSQYALAPRVVLRSTEPEWIVGNFSAPPSADSINASGAMQVKDYQNGIWLMKRRPRN
jgi:hypothetical protein